jgi:putative CocE/NonD family hydrolase
LPHRPTRIVKNVAIAMRHGGHLAADLYVPDAFDLSGGRRFPVVMEYLPYRKDDTKPGSGGMWYYDRLPQSGYVFARVDIRGTGASPGVSTDEYTRDEQLDGYDAVEWLAAQPWCDGNVNMMGISYGGFTALQVASHAPPHLRSIVPIYFTDDRYADDCHLRGGHLRQYYDAGYYGARMVMTNALPPDPDQLGDDFAEVWEQHLASNEPWILEWLRHQVDGPYWRNGSVGDVADRIECPVFMIGGWRDGYTNPPLRLYSKLTVPRKILIGPWQHMLPDIAVPGPRIDYLHEVLRWFDHWCNGADTGILDEPPIVVYMQQPQAPVVDRLETDGEWRAEREWPAPGAQERTLFLGDARVAEEPSPDGAETFEYDPTVGVAGGGLFSGGLSFGLPGDQCQDEALSLCYTSDELTEDVHVLGRARVLLYASSTATVIGFCVSLSDVAPDGTSVLVAKGMLNATRVAGSHTDPAPLVPGRVYEVPIEIDATGWVFPAGHRIRVAVASADWPNVWPTPEPATNTIHRGAANPSRLVLPVVPPHGSADPPEFRPSTRSAERQRDMAEPPLWEASRNLLTERTEVRMALSGGERIHETRALENGATISVHVDPRRPWDSGVRTRAWRRIVRPGSVVEGRLTVALESTKTHLHATIDLEILADGAPHFSRHWTESTERRLL